MRDADEIIAMDPFWSQVRKYAPSVDVVLVDDESLPDELERFAALATADHDQAPDPTLLDTVPGDFGAWLDDLWLSMVGDTGQVEAWWSPGDDPDLLDREGWNSVDGIDVAAGYQTLGVAERILSAAGWSGLVPEDGIPRVIASREVEARVDHVEVIYVPTKQRLALKARWCRLKVGVAAANATLEGTA